MKRKRKFKNVKELPDGAMTVFEYAKRHGCSTSWVYRMVWLEEHTGRESPIDIIEYQNVNFVVLKH